MTAQTLSDLSGISVSTINNIFSGRVTKPSFENVYALAKALETSVNEIMGDNLTQIVANDKIIDSYENRLVERRQMYEDRVDEQRRLYDGRLAEQAAVCEARISVLKEMYTLRMDEQRDQYDKRLAAARDIIQAQKRRTIFHIAAIAALISFALFLIFIDARIPDWGLIQYAISGARDSMGAGGLV